MVTRRRRPPADPLHVMNDRTCPLCHPVAEHLLYRDTALRIIGVETPGLPGYCRVIWNRHVEEMTFLRPSERDRLMDAVWTTEGALRAVLQPVKVNLASLGNQVAHLHWHVIARFRDDPFYPDAIWAQARRPVVRHATDWAALAGALRAALAPPTG
jgi:diadenosine tetraphosphate (Ap4A) HIT family hydrolase